MHGRCDCEALEELAQELLCCLWACPWLQQLLLGCSQVQRREALLWRWCWSPKTLPLRLPCLLQLLRLRWWILADLEGL